MGILSNLLRAANDGILIDKALKALQESTGVAGVRIDEPNFDDQKISLSIAGEEWHLRCEALRKVSRNAEIVDLRHRAVRTTSELLVTSLVSQELAVTCRAQGVQFIDCAGNAYLNPSAASGVYVYVTGLKPVDDLDVANPMSISTPSGLRLIFALISAQRLLNQPYREIAETAQIAIGSVSATMKALEQRGYVATTSSGQRELQHKGKLIGEWVAGYAGRLRPKMETIRFACPDMAELRQLELDPETAAWGAEEAAARVSGFLKPEILTIYTDIGNSPFVSDLVKRHRLRRDPNGLVELVQPFWDLSRFRWPQQCVPPLLIYADLMLSGDARNSEAAEQILDRLLYDA